ncbi:uncharacterized protein LOC120425946 [Culex pipiens pallens]|uniref:uncharacterized protein LOC120425946 n=1 Tax=Culex pipiens pallens TaxID=42434 RepID=UPI0022AAB528|nr:uncharacterized protein LOC120425946 [Culex pipiens pallens]
MARMVVFLLVVIVTGILFEEANSDGNSTITESDHLLSRRKRFLLFPVNGNLLITASGGKAMIFRGPGGNVAILELDLYYPLPDYRYRISQLRLGEIAMLPSVAPPPQKLVTTTTTPIPIDSGDRHDGHEVSPMEVHEYLKDHPDTWVPPGYGKDRSDWFPAGTYNPYVNKWRQSYPNPQPYQRTSWKPSSANSHRYIPRMKRSSNSGDQLKQEFEQEEDRFNISHHRDWEHFYHYRERRELYHMLETGLGNKFDIALRSCIMRAICEVRSFLQPPGRSMIMDLVRILFSVPLKADLNDEYSNAMRSERLDCHELYGKQCPISFLYLLLFGKFVP